MGTSMVAVQPSESAGQAQGAGPSRLQSDLAARILRLLKDQGAGPGHRLVELDLCQQFGVSRTPIRGALRQLETQGWVESRANRGFILLDPVTEASVSEPVNAQDEEDKALISRIAEARVNGKLARDVTQEEICRLFNVKLPTAVRVLRRLADLGLVERKPGNGWSFLQSIDNPRAHAESYALRRIIEPQLVLQKTFELDREWLENIKARHLAFRKMKWRDSLAVEFYNMNSDFHEGLARCSGNRFMLSAVQKQIQLRTFLNYYWSAGKERPRASIDEHLAIIAALERGDREEAAALIVEHLNCSESVKNDWDHED